LLSVDAGRVAYCEAHHHEQSTTLARFSESGASGLIFRPTPRRRPMTKKFAADRAGSVSLLSLFFLLTLTLPPHCALSWDRPTSH
jgi:hypothetical protein